jgi:Zn-dependent protease
MRLMRHFNEGLRVFSTPMFIAAYFAYSFLNAFFAKFLIPVHILAVIFLEPLLFSYFVSRYFIDAVDSARRSEHRRLRLRFYAPFVKIFGVLFVLTVLIQSAYFGHNQQTGPVPVFMLGVFGFFSLTVVFWMAATAVCGRGVWHGLQRAFFLMRRNAVYCGLFFLIYGAFAAFQDLRVLRGGGLAAIAAFHAVYAVIDLYIIKVTIGLAVESFGPRDSKAVLDGYAPGGNGAVVPAPMPEQIKKANVCFLLGLLSIVPIVHFFAAILGWKRFRNQEFGRFRSFVGCMLGIFFTCIYCLSLFTAFAFQKAESSLAHISSLEAYSRGPGVSQELKEILNMLKTNKGRDSLALANRLEVMRENSAARYFALGVARSYADQPQAALAAFRKCGEFPGGTPEALFHIGRLSLFDRRDYFEARNSLVKFLTYEPRDKTARNYLSLIDNRVGWDNNWVISILSVIALLIAMTAHEFGHSYAAYRCGDATSKEAGRMSLNPIVHLDLLGSIVLPAFLILSRSGIIVGWAKPVPVNEKNFKNPQRDRTLVSLMGCLTNFAIALTVTVVLILVTVVLRIAVPGFMTIHWLYPSDFISVTGVPFAKAWIYAVIFLILTIMINIAIGIFNLIPIPPLDGSWIVERKLAPLLKEKYAVYQQFSFLLILILLFTNSIDIVISSCLNAYFFLIHAIILPGFYVT